MKSIDALRMKSKLVKFWKEIEGNSDNADIKQKIENAILAMEELNHVLFYAEVDRGEF